VDEAGSSAEQNEYSEGGESGIQPKIRKIYQTQKVSSFLLSWTNSAAG